MTSPVGTVAENVGTEVIPLAFASLCRAHSTSMTLTNGG